MKQRVKSYSALIASVMAVWLVSLIVGNTIWTKFLAEKVAERPFLVYKNLPFPTVIPDVKAGEIIPLMVDRCNDTDENQNYNTTRTLENVVTHESYLLPEARTLLKPGCTKSVSMVNPIPDGVPPGKYFIYGTAEVRGNAHLLLVDWSSQQFNVIK